MHENYGFIPSSVPLSAWRFGAQSTERKILSSVRDFTNFLPVFESQNRGFETMSCVAHSALNCLEIIGKVKEGREDNWSDRFTAKMSGTTKTGNTFWAVAESIRKNNGLVQEGKWPFEGKTFEEYMKPVPSELQKEGLKLLEDEVDISYEYVFPSPEKLWEALQFAPLQVSVRAWESPSNGVYRRTDKIQNHAVTLFKGEIEQYWYIYDHYSPEKIKKLSWDFLFGGALLFDITSKSMSPIKILRKKGEKDVGFWIPAIDEAALVSYCYAYGKPVKETGDGKIDWEAMVEGEFEEDK